MKPNILILLFALLSLAACKETEETTEYDNWRQRNDAFADSLYALAGDNYLVWNDPAPAPETRASTQVPQMRLGELYAILVQDAATTAGQQYTYAKKLVDNPQGKRLLYTDQVSVYYRGTYINGVEFDGNFDGYGALDQQVPLDQAAMKWPTDFDLPATFSVNGLVSGMTWTLQFARTGERWLLYIPYEVGYGEDDYTPSIYSTTIPGCSLLTFDVVIVDLVDED